jgi:hypothetical protein
VTTSNLASAKFRKTIFLHASAKMRLKPKDFWMHLNLQLKLEATETSPFRNRGHSIDTVSEAGGNSKNHERGPKPAYQI